MPDDTTGARVYLRRTRWVAHELSRFDSVNDGYPACCRCGQQPELGESWLGTGSYDESQTAAELRLCKKTEATTS